MLKNEKRWGYLFIAPLTLGVLMFVLVPLFYSLFVAFSEYDLINPPKFTGPENIKILLNDQYFFKSLLRSFINLINVPIAITIGLFTSVMLSKIRLGSSLFRSIFLLPAVCSSVAVIFMWQYFLNYDYGVVNWFLVKLGFERVMFLGDDLGMASMIVMGIWGGLGIKVLLFYAALKNVPAVYYEAAMIDGANAWKQFWKITLPGISPVLLYVLITQMIAALQDSTRFMVMSGNGASETFTTAGVYVYLQTFSFGAPGYASTCAWALGLIIMLATLLNFGFSRKWVNYDV